MKKGIAALLTVLLLTGCGAAGAAGGGSLTEEDASGAETAIQSETLTAENGCANLALTLPEGWEGAAANTPKDGGMDACRIEFWPADAPELRLTLCAYPDGIGLCGTGVTIEEVAFEGGQTATLYTEQIGDDFWLCLIYGNTPGAYAAEFTGARTLLEQYEQPLAAILGSAVLGEGFLRQSEAEKIASDAFAVDYEEVCGRFDMNTGVWTVTFLTSDATEVGSLCVGPDGKLCSVGNEADTQLCGLPRAGRGGDYPAALMVEDTVYLLSQNTVPAEIGQDAIIGYTVSYTDTFPEKNGETNFSRTAELPIAQTESGVAVCYEGAWRLCTPQRGA